MANDTRKITIEILSSDGGGSGGEKKSIGEEKEKKKKVTDIYKKELLKARAYKHAINQAIGATINVAEYAVNRYFTLSEDYLNQNIYNNVKHTINKGASLGRTAFSIATMAATGNIPGAVVTGAVSIINEGMQYYQRMSGYYQALNATNYQTGFSATRAGLVNDSRGTEN